VRLVGCSGWALGLQFAVYGMWFTVWVFCVHALWKFCCLFFKKTYWCLISLECDLPRCFCVCPFGGKV